MNECLQMRDAWLPKNRGFPLNRTHEQNPHVLIREQNYLAGKYTPDTQRMPVLQRMVIIGGYNLMFVVSATITSLFNPNSSSPPQIHHEFSVHCRAY